MSNFLSETKSERQTGALNPAKTTRMLLRLIRALQPISRIEIARRLDVNRSTVTEIVRPLISGGIIREDSFETQDTNRPQGRPPIGLYFNDEDDFFVGLNLGVKHTQVGLATITGEILAEEEFETPPEAESALKTARKKIAELCGGIEKRALRTIGVSVPGPTDETRRKLLYAPHLSWSDVAVADALSFDGVPVIVENDATAAALFESRMNLIHSTESSLDNFILVRSGTGIGVGLVIDDEIYRGTGRGQGFAGEFGHMTILAGGKACVCGNRGCWEKYASASSAAELYTGDRAFFDNTKMPRFVEIVARAEAGEIRARKTLEKIGEYLGVGIANVIMGIGVHQVIVSGRLVYGWKFIKLPLREAVKRSIVGKTSHWTVECGEPKGSALGGALEVAVEEYLMRGLKI
ncbi:MAG: ROK family transcriptional regulator [Acidobacteriota bacterium]|nr:ROK family transcriptional regulator [Acidobacteriota bacterium]